MASNGAGAIVDQFFAALSRKDLAAMRGLLRDDLAFTGPLATLEGADAYLEGIQHATARMADIRRRVAVADGEDVLQVYDVFFEAPDGAPRSAVPVAEWLTVRDGRIAAIQVILDTGPFTAAATATTGHAH